VVIHWAIVLRCAKKKQLRYRILSRHSFPLLLRLGWFSPIRITLFSNISLSCDGSLKHTRTHARARTHTHTPLTLCTPGKKLWDNEWEIFTGSVQYHENEDDIIELMREPEGTENVTSRVLLSENKHYNDDEQQDYTSHTCQGNSRKWSSRWSS